MGSKRAKLKEKVLCSSSSSDGQMRAPKDDERRRDVDRRGKASSMEMSQPPSQSKYSSFSPFIPKILAAPFPAEFNMPSMETYNGTSDPVDHLQTFKIMMSLHEPLENIMCRAFPLTLRGAVLKWFISLPPESISSFEKLSELFIGRFICMKKLRKTSPNLTRIKQHEGESLRSYICRFNLEALEVPDLDESVAVLAVMEGVQESRFKFSLSLEQPKDMNDLLAMAAKYINSEEIEAARREDDRREEARLNKPKRKGNHN
ncbi:hypothetical protein J5N97_002904 [Dioscorea zingiberensis]|uniref:Retrotransposon gag domain-containing protein n=1 Tax=Dioscorea zingiberensis TaxID=325984 RepID=A0A9D5D5P1_9LILI|nr:hypothetical protein J5N97_002904 [Dioscorea zingiberensis]